ncbi:MAG: exonuclease SbcCD subunit D [Lachnospiraceae bacterium]|nr:exonuclease SbcCD subunit D [Lachnospiraceae bacterium]
MKFFHISDLHIGKRVNGFSMMEDQRYILRQILDLAEEQHPEGILIAGDLYDKSMPSAEAVELVDWFLSQFAALEIPVWAISGNHDSAERVAYGGQMLEKSGIHMARVFDGRLQKYELPEQKVDIYLLPYLRPSQVRRFFPEQEIETTQQAVEAVLAETTLREGRTNILVMHQFLAGASVCDSEEISIGGLDQVDASVVDGFDYVALGHLHRPQRVGRETVRYCGSPLKYSFSEAGHRKSVTVVETAEPAETAETVEADCEEQGDSEASFRRAASEDGKTTNNRRVTVTTIPLLPKLDLREIRGPLEKLLQKEVYAAANPQDYLHITLTDENEILDAIGKLREVYPNIMRLDFEKNRVTEAAEQKEVLVGEKTPEELFEEFFLQQNGREMDNEQKHLAAEVMKQIYRQE